MDTAVMPSAPERPERAVRSGMVVLFTTTSFLTAALLFLVQPMVGRMVLPAFGGSPQVWTTSMLFFQTALLAGYGYTHVTTTRIHREAQPWVHLVVALLPALVLPIALTVTPSGRPGIAPSVELLTALLLGVAAPFVFIATSGPLVQRWFSWTDHPRAHDPYFLYAAGNIGSAVGLLGYPFLLEPVLSIEAQSRLWAGGYTLALVLLAGCAWLVRHRPGPSEARDSSDAAKQQEAAQAAPATQAQRAQKRTLDIGRGLRWVGLAFVPSSLMLAATTALSTDIAAVPLLWIAPLGAYLLTFTVAFSSWGPRAYRAAVFVAPAVIIAAITVRPLSFGVPVAVTIQVALVLVGGLVAHGKLAADRPPPALLTRFYLLLAIGGALGGLFNSIVAPLLFPTVLEYAVITVITLALVLDWRELVPGTTAWPRHRRVVAQLLVAAIPVGFLLVGAGAVGDFGLGVSVALLAALVALSLGRWARGGAIGTAVLLVALVPHALQLAQSESVERTFFGIHRVAYIDDEVLGLFHGTTLHGTQDLSSMESRRTATTYYHPEQPLGDIVAVAGSDPETVIGALGLGVGSIAAYGQPTQTFVFHEIDPAVVDIARTRFTFLSDSPARTEVILGDGRLTLEDAENAYALLVVDAFTSDAIPVHLLTVEAIAGYLDAVAPGGVIALNISNRHLDLAPVLTAAADELRIDGVLLSGDGSPEGATPSIWVALSDAEGRLDQLRELGWGELPDDRQLWTDQRSSLFSVLR